MNLLLSTGDAKLTHKKAKKPWSETFPEILMKIRDEFKSKQKPDEKKEKAEKPKQDKKKESGGE